MNQIKPKLTLTRPATYEIKVPGNISESFIEWSDRMMVSIERLKNGSCITAFTGTIDQAALHGLLSQIYALGLPLISVIWVEDG